MILTVTLNAALDVTDDVPGTPRRTVTVVSDEGVTVLSEPGATTAEVVAYCRERGVWVEAELGEVGGKDGVHAAGARTDPDEARSYVDATGVAALAVAVGTSHAMLTRDATVDLELIARLHEAVPVPLVLHGSSGVPDDDLRRAVAARTTKINIATRLSKVFTASARAYLDENPRVVDTRRYLGAARDALAGEVARLLRLLA